jgi:hypothetical protein
MTTTPDFSGRDQRQDMNEYQELIKEFNAYSREVKITLDAVTMALRCGCDDDISGAIKLMNQLSTSQTLIANKMKGLLT